MICTLLSLLGLIGVVIQFGKLLIGCDILVFMLVVCWIIRQFQNHKKQ